MTAEMMHSLLCNSMSAYSHRSPYHKAPITKLHAARVIKITVYGNI